MPSDIPDRWNRPIFVASMGRSGSTLLQRVLNVHPDITVWGEHGGMLSGVLESYATAHKEPTKTNLADGYEHRNMVIGELAQKDTFKPWVSPFQAEDVAHSLRSMLVDLFTKELSPEIRWGFKEIRYSETELRSLLTLFPEANLVVLARDLPGYAQSRFFAFGNTDFDLESNDGRSVAKTKLKTMMNGWMKRYEQLVSLRDEFADRAVTVAYGDLTAESEVPAEIFQKLNEQPPAPEAIDAVLTAKAGSSFKHNSAARSNRARLAELIAETEIDRDRLARVNSQLGLS